MSCRWAHRFLRRAGTILPDYTASQTQTTVILSAATKRVALAAMLEYISEDGWFRLWPGHSLFRLRLFVVFLECLQANVGIVAQVGHDHVLPNPFQFTRRYTIHKLTASQSEPRDVLTAMRTSNLTKGRETLMVIPHGNRARSRTGCQDECDP
jgi:hypothetical protein